MIDTAGKGPVSGDPTVGDVATGNSSAGTEILKRVVILGCGYVGSELARQLLADGVEVWGVRRRIECLPEGVHGVSGDLSDAERVLKQLPPCDAAVYCAAADGREESDYRRAYIDGMRASMEALKTHPLRRFVFTSSTGVYSEASGKEVDETTPPKPSGFRAEVLLEAEALCQSLEDMGVVVRLSGIYGPSRTRLVRQVAAGQCHLEGALAAAPKYTNRIHRDDCAGAVRHLLRRKAHVAPLYLASDTQPSTWDEVVRFLADELDVQLPSAFKPSPRQGSKRCVSALLRSHGYRFRYPTFREGYRAVIASLEPSELR